MLPIISSIFLWSCSVFANEELIRAALDNDVERARTLLDEGADIDYLDEEDEMTALMCGSCMGNVEMVRFLVRRKAEMGCEGNYIETALHTALLQCQAGTADVLWETNGRKMSRSSEGNLLHMCCARESPEMSAFMRKILEAGVDVEHLNEKDDRGNSPLLAALKRKNAEAAWLMIRAKCDVRAKGESMWTALHWASRNEGFTPLVEYFLKAGVELEATDVRKETPLHVALRDGPAQTVQLLMEADANVWTDAFRGSSALHLAAARKGFEKITKKLLEKGVDVKKKHDDGNTCLHEALQSGSPETAELLLQYDVDFKALDVRGQSALHLAACRKDTARIVEFLVGKGGVDINAKNGQGNAPLHNALKRGRDQVARKLLRLGANFHLLGKNNVSPLALASGWEKFYDVAKMILECGFDPNASDANGMTALHVAADQCCIKIIRLLLSFGANVNANCFHGFYEGTPLTTAALSRVKCNRRETIRFIIDNGGRIDGAMSPVVLFVYMADFRPENAEVFLKEYPETEFYDELLDELVKRSVFDGPEILIGLDEIVPDREFQAALSVIINNGANITNGEETLRMFSEEISYEKPSRSETFPEFLAAAIKKRIPPSGHRGNIVESYSKSEIFALYRLVKKWYEEEMGGENGGNGSSGAYDEALKKRQFRYYDEIIVELTKGTYAYALPNDLVRDVLENVHCRFAREISKLSWILSLVEATTTTEKITDENERLIQPGLILRHFENENITL